MGKLKCVSGVSFSDLASFVREIRCLSRVNGPVVALFKRTRGLKTCMLVPYYLLPPFATSVSSGGSVPLYRWKVLFTVSCQCVWFVG